MVQTHRFSTKPPVARRWARRFGVLLGLVLASSSARALELRGKTYFSKPPWSVDLISYYTTVWETWAEYYFTVQLDPAAGAALGGLEITQTRGVDRTFPFNVGATRAFLGRPRQQGAAVPVEASFDAASRTFSISFPEPVAPGSTVTVSLKPWNNPAMADTYMFQVTAFPSGPNPSPTPLGYGTLRIYMPDRL
ncbi:MAG: DUF2808 domain-containing protein [Cyanobacteriota bacterium]|nr:DUF2808 domain-containing protein [Cyanobacteriota bacterium]